MAQMVASMSNAVLGGVVKVVGSNLVRGKIFKASNLHQFLIIYIYIYPNKKETSNFRGTISFDSVKMSHQK